MKNWRDALISDSCSLRDAVTKMSETGWQIAVVVDAQSRLVGVLTDGDIRRALLQGRDLASDISAVMNPAPVVMESRTPVSTIRNKMRQEGFHFIPLVDANHIVQGIATIDELVGAEDRPNPVVIMAGGFGRRLHPLTENFPKPMLQVGDKPILETIVSSFAQQGFRNIHLSVNFRSDVVEAHFGSGEEFGVTITYLHESKPLGTAGALSLLQTSSDLPIIVMNGDLLTRMSGDALLEFHDHNRADATMVVRETTFDLPYGVVSVDNVAISQIAEKPKQAFLVNAGIYVINPDVARSITPNEYLDMPTLFNNLIGEKRKVIAFPLHEYWIDIGRLEELERAQIEWNS
jgi:dTDP-glucose pyrophosphorylase/CBS domain-containing protein